MFSIHGSALNELIGPDRLGTQLPLHQLSELSSVYDWTLGLRTDSVINDHRTWGGIICRAAVGGAGNLAFGNRGV